MQGKCKKGMERMKTKAVRIHGKMDLRLEEIELPQVGPDDVQVKVISDSICMSTYKAAVEGRGAQAASQMMLQSIPRSLAMNSAA